MNNKTQLTPEQLEQWQQDLERDTKVLRWVFSASIVGSFIMTATLGIWVYLAYTH